MNDFDQYIKAIENHYMISQDETLENVIDILQGYEFTVPEQYSQGKFVEHTIVPDEPHLAHLTELEYVYDENMARLKLTNEIFNKTQINNPKIKYTGGVSGVLKSQYFEKVHEFFEEQAIENQ